MVIYKAWEDGSTGTGSDRFAGERRCYNQDFKIVLEKKFGIMEKIVQTAGRDTLGEFAHFNDDILFGENWNNHDIDVKTRSILTVVTLMPTALRNLPSSIIYRMQRIMALRREKYLQSLPMWHFMWDGQRAGRFFILQRKYGR